MKTTRLSLVLMLMLAASFWGCEGTSTSSDPIQGSTVTGTIWVWQDPFTKVPAKDALLKFDSTSFEARTDSNGKFTIEGMPTGTYTVTITKEGYAELKNFEFQLAAPGMKSVDHYLQGFAPLYPVAKYGVSNLRLDSTDPKNIAFSYDTSNVERFPKGFRMNTTAMLSDVDPHTATPTKKEFFLLSANTGRPYYGTGLKGAYPYSKNAPFVKGESVYLTLYPTFANPVNIDPYTGTEYPVELGTPSNTVRFTHW